MTNLLITNRVLHQVDRKVYGHFIEELGACIHDGLWAYDDRLKALPALETPLDRVRRDVFSAAGELAVGPAAAEPTVLRWPGGCFADSYDWTDGVGPRGERPLKPNGFWGTGIRRLLRSRYGRLGPPVPNHFGTDEFLALCEALAVEPYLNVNYGTGTPQQAADWVEYVNGAETTRWGSRRPHDHPDPYGVRIWGIANEIWARWEFGHERTATAYAERYLEFAAAMRECDPSIELVACGLDPNAANPLMARDSRRWNRNLLERASEAIDYLSVHYYVPLNSAPWRIFWPGPAYARNPRAAQAVLASPALVRAVLERVWADVVAVQGAETKLRLALDEWNLWYAFPQIVKANFTLVDGLWVALMLQLLQEMGPVVGMANIAQMVNVVGLIRTDDEGVVRTPSHHAFAMIASTAHANLLSCETDAEPVAHRRTFGVPAGERPAVGATATRNDAGNKLSITLVNRDLRSDTQVEVEFAGFSGSPACARASVLHHPDPFARNTPSDRTAITPQTLAPPEGGRVTLPRHSLTVLEFEV